MRISTSILWPCLLIVTNCFLTVSSADLRSTSTLTPRSLSTTTINTATTTSPHKFIPPPVNITDVLDVRTPPRIKQMMKKIEQKHHQSVENSHPGVAEPVDEDSIGLDEANDSKKMNFYKLEPKSTTDIGLSTWVLLSGQISSTQKPVKIAANEKNETKNIAIGNPNRVIKPVFKKKPSNNQLVTSTEKITTITTKKIGLNKEIESNVKSNIKNNVKSNVKSTDKSTVKSTVKSTIKSTTEKSLIEKSTTAKSLTEKSGTENSLTEKSTTEKSSTLDDIVTKITKVKASILNNSITKTNNPDNYNKDKENIKIQISTSSTQKISSSNENENEKIPSSTEVITEKPSTTISTINLKPELKEGDLELPSSTPNTKKNRRPTQKKKKNKNRTRRPSAEEKIDNKDTNNKDTNNKENNNKETKTKIAIKDKPISTQIYNYLAKEVMPTVGVGLVGLVVTAGLASYFLYPFGTLRRTYEIDRKDKGNTYYYENEYSGGVPEEEAIGKVIAGMPFYDYNKQNQNYQNDNTQNIQNIHNIQSIQNRQNQHQSMISSNRYRYRHSDNVYNPQATVEEIQLDPLKDYKHDGNYLQESYQTNEVHKNEPITYNKDVLAKNVEASYSSDINDDDRNQQQRFVVSNVPKEVQVQEVTPVAVPEHGPRSLKIRRKREVTKRNFNGKNMRFRKKIGKL